MKIIEINPNDVLLIKTNVDFTRDEINYIRNLKEVFEAKLNCKVLVHGNDIELTLLKNEPNEADTAKAGTDDCHFPKKAR